MLETGLYLWGFPGAALGAALITSLVSGGTQPQLTRAHNFKRLPYQPTKISQLKVFGFLAILFQAPNLTVCDFYISKLLKVFVFMKPISNFQFFGCLMHIGIKLWSEYLTKWP